MDLSSNTHKAVALQIAAEILKQSVTEPSAVTQPAPPPPPSRTVRQLTPDTDMDDVQAEGTLPIRHKPSVQKDPLKNTFHVRMLSLLAIHSAELLSAEIANIPGGQKNQNKFTRQYTITNQAKARVRKGFTRFAVRERPHSGLS